MGKRNNILLIGMSEYIAILIIGIIGFIPFHLIGTAAETKMMLSILPPHKPEINKIIIYPKINAIGIGGQMGYAQKIMWLDDQEQGEIIQLVTDENSSFIVPIDKSSLMLKQGMHKVVAYLNLSTKKESLVKSNAVGYLIDANNAVILDPISGQGVALSTQDITMAELRQLQENYKMTKIRPNNAPVVPYWQEGFQEAYFWYILWKWSILLIYLMAITILVIRRYRRKRNQGQSFWSIGRGFYFDPKNYI